MCLARTATGKVKEGGGGGGGGFKKEKSFYKKMTRRILMFKNGSRKINTHQKEQRKK